MCTLCSKFYLTHTTNLRCIRIDLPFEIRQCPTGNDVAIGLVPQWWDAGDPRHLILPIRASRRPPFLLRSFGRQTNRNQANSDRYFPPDVDQPNSNWGCPPNDTKRIPEYSRTTTDLHSTEVFPRTINRQPNAFRVKFPLERLPNDSRLRNGDRPTNDFISHAFGHLRSLKGAMVRTWQQHIQRNCAISVFWNFYQWSKEGKVLAFVI